jgi:surfactin synthase thioesterase subunit
MAEFREHFLKIVRSDLAAADSYKPAPDRVPLACPLTAFGGTTDPLALPEMMHSWMLETRGSFQQSLFPGGHFYFLGPAFPGFMHELVAEVLSAAILQNSSNDWTHRALP